MKAKIAAGVLALATLLGGGYFGKKYFDEHYILLNEQDIVGLTFRISLMQQEAYVAGKQACNKTTSF